MSAGSVRRVTAAPLCAAHTLSRRRLLHSLVLARRSWPLAPPHAAAAAGTSLLQPSPVRRGPSTYSPAPPYARCLSGEKDNTNLDQQEKKLLARHEQIDDDFLREMAKFELSITGQGEKYTWKKFMESMAKMKRKTSKLDKEIDEYNKKRPDKKVPKTSITSPFDHEKYIRFMNEEKSRYDSKQKSSSKPSKESDSVDSVKDNTNLDQQEKKLQARREQMYEYFLRENAKIALSITGQGEKFSWKKVKEFIDSWNTKASELGDEIDEYNEKRPDKKIPKIFDDLIDREKDFYIKFRQLMNEEKSRYGSKQKFSSQPSKSYQAVAIFMFAIVFMYILCSLFPRRKHDALH